MPTLPPARRTDAADKVHGCPYYPDMDPVVESALISAGATVLGIGATAAVAIAGFRISRSASDNALVSARETNQATIQAARADVQATLQTTRDGQIADLYGKAIEQLGSDKLDVRIGGIYALERIARDSPRDQPTVVEVLSAFVREHSHEQWPAPVEGSQQAGAARSTRPDVQAALTVVGRRDAEHDIRPIDFTSAELGGANLNDANLNGASLRGADLNRADLTRANLSYAQLNHADLTGAHLDRANLNDADLSGAHLDRAVITGARLDRADLTGAILTDTDLTNAHLDRANLTGAHLTRANLTNAILYGADLSDANLTGAILYGADLIGANLTSADLTSADLSGADLSGARYLEDMPVPEGWRLDPSSGRLDRAHTGSGQEEAS